MQNCPGNFVSALSMKKKKVFETLEFMFYYSLITVIGRGEAKWYRTAIKSGNLNLGETY